MLERIFEGNNNTNAHVKTMITTLLAPTGIIDGNNDR